MKALVLIFFVKTPKRCYCESVILNKQPLSEECSEFYKKCRTKIIKTFTYQLQK